MISVVTLPAEKVQLGTGADGPSFTTGVAALELLGDEEEEDEVNLEMVGWLVSGVGLCGLMGSLPKYGWGLWSSCWFEKNLQVCSNLHLTFSSLLVAGIYRSYRSCWPVIITGRFFCDELGEKL